MAEYKKIWDTEFVPKIEQAYSSIKDSLIHPNVLEENHLAEQALITADRNYKVKHNEFTYFLWWVLTIISCILIIPAYWVVKKVKALKANKQALLDDVASKEQEALIVHEKIVNKLDILKLEQHMSDIIKYKNMGPIPQSLIDGMQQLSLFDLEGNANKNTYKTSWGVYDNKILIHLQDQQHIEYLKTYTGSVSVSYSRGQNDYGVDVVSASIQRPAFRVDTNKWTYAFMQSCSNLEFDMEGKKNRLLDGKYNKKHNYAALENPIFEKKTKWSRTDEAQFRMIFTPFAQETWVNETDGCKDINSVWDWSKRSSFIFNDYLTDAHTEGLVNYIADVMHRFTKAPRMTTDQLLNEMLVSIKNYFRHIYNSMPYMWATTIMPSENHAFLIKSVLDGKFVGNNMSLLSHNILASDHPNSYAIKGADMATFPKYHSSITKKIAGVNFYTNTFKTKSYRIEQRVTYVKEYSSLAGRWVSVPVHYDEYIPLHSEADMTFAHIPSHLVHFRRGHRLLSNLTNGRLVQLLDSCNIQYENGYLSFNTNSNVTADILSEIIKLINESNSNLNSNKNSNR